MNICRSKDGFIKLHYKIQDSDLWNDNNAMVVFLRMIGYAHYEDDFTSIRFKGKQTYLKRGEFAASVSELAQLTNLSVGTLRDVLVRLESDKRISKQSDNRITIFRICNYSKYQDVPTKSPASKPTNKATNDTTNDPTSPTEGKKNIKNIKKLNIYMPEVEKAFSEWNSLASVPLKQTAASKKSCEKLIKEYGYEDVREAIHGAIFFQGKEYRPQVFSFTSMEEKWANLKTKRGVVIT